MTKIQLRRGTASQWSTANTVLSAGEAGWDSTAGKLKIGDGTTAWNSLAYFLDTLFVMETEVGVANGVASLDSSGKVPEAQLGSSDFGYIFANFTGNGYTGENLNIYYSPDGKSVYGGGGNPVYKDPTTNSLRDPSLIMLGSMYYVAYTRNNGADKVFDVIGGSSLANLATVATVNLTGLSDISRIWAPEFVIDPAQPTRPYIFFSKINAAGTTGMMYWVQATNDALTSWTSATAMSWASAPAHYIDGVPIKHTDNKWYMFYSTGADILRAWSNTLTGTYTTDKTGNWASWGTDIEGPEVIVDTMSGKYRIYFDRFGAGTGYAWSESTDLNTWSSPVSLVVAPYTLPPGGKVRHGSFLPIKTHAVLNMVQALMLQPRLDPQIVFTGSRSHGPTGTVTNMGTPSVHSSSNNDVMVTAAGAGKFTFLEAGDYEIHSTHSVTVATGVTRTFADVASADGTVLHAREAGAAEDAFKITVPTFRAVAGEQLLLRTFVAYTGGQGSATVGDTIRITRRSR